MDAKTYLKISGINLIFLSVGILVGIALMSGVIPVHAQVTDKATTKVERAPAAPIPQCDDSRFECVTPLMTASSAGFGTVLANRIASDQLMVNGFEPLKLHDATISTLQSKGYLTAGDVKEIVEAGRVKKPLRLKTQ